MLPSCTASDQPVNRLRRQLTGDGDDGSQQANEVVTEDDAGPHSLIGLDTNLSPELESQVENGFW